VGVFFLQELTKPARIIVANSVLIDMVFILTIDRPYRSSMNLLNSVFATLLSNKAV
jgi:predicted nucleic-acid-binding protein